MYRVAVKNGRRCLSVGVPRPAVNQLRLQQYAACSDVHTVNQPDQMELQENPDYNVFYGESPHMAWPPRPFMLGRPGTALEALRGKEQSDWKDLSDQEKEDLYRGFFERPLIETFQGTDMWKGIAGTVLLLMCVAATIDHIIKKNTMGWAPNQVSFWWFWQPGWQQIRKNEAAYNICWEYDNTGNQRDIDHWDYVNHCWKRPCFPRIDISY